MNQENLLTSFCNTHDLENLVKGPTCFKGENPTCIDVILSNEPNRFKSTINVNCSLSDFHNIVCTATKLQCPPEYDRKLFYRSYRKFNEESYTEDLQNMPLSVCDVFDDIDDKVWCFHKLVTDVMDINAPVKCKVIDKPSVPYMNGSLRRNIHYRNMLRNKYRRGLVTWETYRKQRNLTTAMYKRSKLTYFRERCEGGPRNQSFWKTIRPFMANKSGPNRNKIILNEDNNIITDDKEICEIFNKYFISVADGIGFPDGLPANYNTKDGFQNIIGTHESHSSILEIKKNVLHTENDFSFTHVNQSDVQKIMESLNTRKAHGFDGMPAKLLKLSAPILAGELSRLINDSIDACSFPDMFKLAVVSSQFKKIDNLIKSNYRPVSILIVMSKVYERVMANQLLAYFENIFSPLLSAFRKNYGCQSTLLNMVQHFKNCIDNGQFVGCIGMDLSKAFDCLPHRLTICKLRAYGASRNACTLLASYLYCRKQRVKISNECSDWGVITKGIPQGSILGPLIFNIFLNDIFYFAKECCMFNYADDNYISVNHKELKLVRDALEEESKVMVEWFNSNSLQANPCKFQGILFKGAKKVNDFRVYVEGTEIEFQSEIDVLGVCIDDDMNFNSHVNNVCKKAGKQVSALQRLTGVLDHKSRMAIYQSFVMANFDYCPLVWFFTSRSSISKLEKIQERALRFVLKDSVSCYDELISKAKMDAFRVSAVKKMATEVFKILNHISPGYFENYFQKARNPYNLRDNNKLVQPMKLTTSHGIKSFQYYGAHLWNSLPTDIKSAVSISQFKGLIRKWSGPDCKCSVCIMILW